MTEPVEIFTSDSDAWDDSALIKAWDSTISSFKSGLSEDKKTSSTTNEKHIHSNTENHSYDKKKISKKRNRTKKKKSVTLTADQWKVGEHCHAKYQDDGLYYSADIVALCDTFATVCYIEYDEICDVMLSDLTKMPPSLTESSASNGLPHAHADSQTNYSTPFSAQKQYSMMPPPPPAPCPVHHYSPYNMYQPQMGHSHGPIPQPPCPPHPFSNSKCNDESLAAMLMSWYKTGFSTGYYQALREHNILPSENCKVPR